VFTAPAGTVPLGVVANTLQSGDVLNGSGQQNVLNATLVSLLGPTISPTINNIPTVNLTALAAGNTLNLGASTGITTIGDVNSVAGVTVTGVKTALTTLNKSGGISRATSVTFENAALAGPANAIGINLDGVDGGNITLAAATPTSTQGYETFNVNAVSASSIGRLISGGSLDNINISGAALSIRGSAGEDALERQLLSFNASAQTGPLVVGRIDNGVGLTQGASVVNASAEDLAFVGSNGGTLLFVEAASLSQGDLLSGGTGANDNLVLTGANRDADTVATPVLGNNDAFTASGFETLTITDTRGDGVGAAPFNQPANFNLANVSGVKTVQLGTASNAVVGLTNLQFTSPLAINVTGNGESSVSAANGVNAVFFGAFGDADTVNYTFGNRGTALNSNNALNNGTLRLPSIENINLTYNDFSTNTTVANTVFAELSTSQLRFISVNAASGDADQNSIQLGTIGGASGGSASVRGGNFASNAGVTATINTNGGASFLTSGAGDHIINVSADALDAGGQVSINGNAGTGDQSFAANISQLNGRVQFTGGTGDDTLSGGNNFDILTGNAGDDDLIGKEGLDVLSAGDNNDFLDGGTFGDILTGGLGRDDFSIIFGDSGNGPTFTATNADVITDFVSGTDAIISTGGSPTQTPIFQLAPASTVNPSAGVAAISATGVATFDASDDTFDERIIAVGAALGSNPVSGTSVIFTGATTGPGAFTTYLYVSDSIGGTPTPADDYLAQLIGVTANNGIIINSANNSITAIS
jgi:hypothetical protein